MANHNASPKQHEGAIEKGSRWGRNVNLAVGGVALAGALIAPPAAALALGTYAGINFAQAGAFEWARGKAQKHRAAKGEQAHK